MADDLDTGADGAESGEETPQRRSSTAGMTRDQYHDKEKAAFLASLGADDDEGESEGGERPTRSQAKPKRVIGRDTTDEDEGEATADEDARQERGSKPGRKPPAREADTEEEDEEEDEGEQEGDEDDDQENDEEEDEDDDEEEEGEDETKDPELAKRLAAVRRTEQRQRERFDRDRAEFDRERSAWQAETKTHREELQRFRDLAARAKYDPAGVLSVLGLTEDDMEYAGKQAYARSKAATAKPEYRAAADQARREREAADRGTANDRRIAELEQRLEARDRQAAEERELEAYFGRVTRKADDSTPRVKALIAKSPKRAREELAQTAYELAKELGELPKAKAVLAAHEKKIVRQLRRYGVDAPAPAAKPGKGKLAAKPSAKPGGKPAAAKPTKPATSGVTFPTREEILRELEEGPDLG